MADGRNVERAGGPPDDPGAHLGDAVVELVLGTVDADRRAVLAAHLLQCPACRREYDELAETVEALLPAVPAAQPPLGFDERVLAALQPGRVSGGRRAPRWRWLAVAAAVLVALLVPLGIWAVVRDDGVDGGDVAGEVATLRLTDGAPVGTVSIGDVAGEPVMVVALVAAPPDVGYFCRTHLADGTVTDSESWPSGNGAWIVPLPDGAEVTSVEVMPTGTDMVWSSASFS
jgi:predicted anti-sigma-YlaC factor YlaD